MKTILGEGVLTWGRYERVGDRYGAVYLTTTVEDEASKLNRSALGACVGKRGKLVATVMETRESHHIGDLFHGYEPGGAAVGMRIELGAGTLFVEEPDWTPAVVGLRPDDGRPTFWLDPKALYKAHDQTVRLEFIEAPQ